MSLSKTETPQSQPATTRTGYSGLIKWGGVLGSPFIFPASIANTGFDMKGMGGFIIGPTILAIAAFFGIAYLLSKKYPGKNLMQKALVVWLVGFLIALAYLSWKEKQRKEDAEASSISIKA